MNGATERASAPIFPFFVGSGRSGTTLLRVIFDSHPELCIPDESNFIPVLARRRASYERADAFDRDLFIEHLLEQRSVRRWGIEERGLWESFESEPPQDYASAVRSVFAVFAQRQGKPRYADKTPRYVMDLPLLAELFPEARFVHVIRDGRDVALSFLDVDFGPRSIGEAARSWRERIEAGRRAGGGLGSDRYQEVRYEALLEDPTGVVTSLCAFLDLAFDPRMLRYFERTDFESLADTWKYRRVFMPPTRGLRDWRIQMSPEDVELFEVLAGRALEDASYERAYPYPSRWARVRAARVTLATRARASVRRGWRGLRSPARGEGGFRRNPGGPFVSEPRLERSEVLSWMIARHADRDEDVRAFREHALGGSLIRLEDVPAWIAARADRGERSAPDRAIEYIGPYGNGRRYAAGDVTLGELIAIGERLVARYPWTPAQATTFVLTRSAPRVDAVRMRVAGGYPIGASTRIVMEIDPAVDPSEVTERYRRLRTRLVPARVWEPDERSLALALIAADQADPQEMLERWNRTYPSFAYEDRERFERDRALARRRLMDPPW